ncbi:MAG: hypothetical protein LBQ20_12185, partial [Rhodanobacter sp.]|nr:hypothetical protein [Rhodanobacter sp.]
MKFSAIFSLPRLGRPAERETPSLAAVAILEGRIEGVRMDDIDTDEWVRELWRPESLDSYTPFEAATRMVGILEKILRFPESGKPWRIERWEMELFPHSFRENLFEYSDAIIKAM